MRAYRLLDWQTAGFDDVLTPKPAADEVLVRVGGVGLCHSDVLFLDSPAGVLPTTSRSPSGTRSPAGSSPAATTSPTSPKATLSRSPACHRAGRAAGACAAPTTTASRTGAAGASAATAAWRRTSPYDAPSSCRSAGSTRGWSPR